MIRQMFLRMFIGAVLMIPMVGWNSVGQDRVQPSGLPEPMTVDFKYSPPEWQTAICLPDDPHKSIVNRNGELLYHYKGRFNTRVSVVIADDAVWKGQELAGPRIPIVRTLKELPGLAIVEEAFAVTDHPGEGARNDIILVQVTNTGSVSRAISPRLVLTDKDPVVDIKDQIVRLKTGEAITSSLKMSASVAGEKDRLSVQLESMTIAAGATERFFVVYQAGSPLVRLPGKLAEAIEYRTKAQQYWQNAPLPYDRIEVPDRGIQALIDSATRNIWQAREIKKNLPVFQVGPTCYRGLWIVDGAFILEAATLLGAGDQARNGVAYELTYQQADGRIKVMKNFSKENGIVLWTCVRHAQLTQDKKWLESMWPKLVRIAEHIKTLRRETLTNDSPIDDCLNPPGFPDGGIRGIRYEYTNPYWNLVGLRSFVGAARWLDKTDEADTWQKEYDAFMAAFRKASARDMRKDAHNNSYLPILMDDPQATELPQRGQWGFCHAVYPGQIFAKDDPLVTGNMAMLAATEREGMVYGTGWDATGIWNYFASFYGHAWLWQGNGRKAAEALYAFANHAAPVLAWREEQSLQGEKYKEVGDMPHNWASAEFIRLAIHLLAIDRGSELHLFEGLPKEWTRPGMVTRLNGIATPFGKLTLELKVAKDGKSAGLIVEPLTDSSCRKIVVHLGGWADKDANAVREFDADKKLDLTITPLSAR